MNRPPIGVRGPVAGLAGTATMAATTVLQAWVLGWRHPIDYDDRPVMVQLAERFLPLQVPDEVRPAAHQILRFGYGSGAGWLRQALENLVRRPALVFFSITWGAEMVLLATLDAAPPPWRWRPRLLITSAAQHVVYAAVTDATFRALTPDRSTTG